MIKSKYTIGSKIHQALSKLEMGGLDMATLRKAINYKDSTKIFDECIIQPLVADKMIHRMDINYYITPIGQSRLESMGRYIIHVPKPRYQKVEWVVYKPTLNNTVRIHADDNFKFPSRRGDKLYYRDGRVESV